MKSALVVSWTMPKAGHERDAIEYGREVDRAWGKAAAEGKCTEPEWYWASRGHSLWIVRGEMEALLGLMLELQPLFIKGQILIDDFEYDIHTYGREEVLAPYEAVVGQVLV